MSARPRPLPRDVPVRSGGGDLAAWNVPAYLLAGIGVYGGIGYALDRWLGTGFLVLVGMLLGAALALYVIWVRYGGSRPRDEGGA